MTNDTERTRAVVNRGAIDGPGGFYRCDTCGDRHGLDGWKWMRVGHPGMVCCGVPMHWWTAREVGRREVPA